MNSYSSTGYPCLILFFLIFQFFAINTSTALADEKLDGLDEFVIRGMADWGIPGLAISVVKEGEIVYEKGFGVRKLGETLEVDQHTIFGVASLTKAMTATALAMLVDEGKIHWDDRVRDHLPWFELSDPWVSDVVTISDLLSHQVGLGRITGNRLRFMPDRDRRTILNFVRHQPFEIPFRSGFLYSNMMYMVAGLIIEAVEGKTWDEFLPERIFTPLNMSSASVSITQIDHDDNAAWPHQEIEGVVQIIPRRNFDNVGPSASVNASARDMAQWMIFNLGEPGKYRDDVLVSLQVMNGIFQPRHAFPVRDPLTNNFSAYAFGWNAGHYDGYRILQHSGGTDGMNSIIVLLPEAELGIFVVGNLFCRFRPAVLNWILDAIMGIDRDYDWHERFFKQHMNQKETLMESRRQMEKARIEGTGPSLSLDSYIGTYIDKVYDDVEVRVGDGGNLELCFWGDPQMIADLEHWHFDTFRASWRNPAMREKFVSFDLDQEGRARQLNVRFTLRPDMIQVGLYPAAYTRMVEYRRIFDK